jgi:RimJ/RimL family protein N-acetyltransferase
MNIHGNNLVLRAIEEFDLTKLHVWANDPKTQDSMGDLHFPSSMEFHRQWFKEQTTDKNNLRFIIDLRSK